MGLAIALGLLGCTSQQTFVDGLPVGERVCLDAEDGCERFTDFARQSLDDGVPGHAEVATVETYVPDIRFETGERILLTRSGGSDQVVVLRLADGTARAYWVMCGRGLDQEWCGLGPPDGFVTNGIWNRP